MNIAAVVVTFNRLTLLKRTIQSLKEVPQLSAIIVVNNGSTDGTGEWLQTQTGLTVINQENTGGSGGFHTGMRYAFTQGYEWIWCMDDDVYPAPDCLEKLLLEAHPGTGILCPRRIQEGKVFVNECRKVNLSNPFTSLHQEKLTADTEAPTEIMGMVFEGPLIRREVVEKIGYPNKELFIFYDDTDYSYRAVLAGYKVVYVPDALLRKELFFTHDTWKEKQKKKKWKRMYQIRNSAYFNHHYGKNFLVRYGRAFSGVAGYILLALCCSPFTDAYCLGDIKRFWKAYTDGIHEQLGKM